MSLLRRPGVTVLASCALAATFTVVGCGSSPLPGTGGDAGSGSSSGGNPPALPQVDDNGGGILTAPEIVTVTFSPTLYTATPAVTDQAGLIADLIDFDDTITQSAYWDTFRAGYCEPLGSTNCVGKGTAINPAVDHVSITAAPASSYTDAPDNGPSTLHTYISGLISAGTLPAPNANTLYVFFFPQSTSITINGGTTCTTIGGYHASLTVGSLDVPYAVVSVCDPVQTAKGTAPLTVEQTATFSASHEISEAVTDPHVAELPTSQTNPYQQLGFDMTNTASQAWPLVLGGGEVADLCLDLLGVGQDRTTMGKYTAQRVWNNVSAAEGHDPCVPIPTGSVYFNVAPPAADDQLQEAVGATQSFDSVAFADGTMDAWTVELVDIGLNPDGSPSTVLTTSPGKLTTAAGDSVACSIKLNSAPPVQAGEQPGSPGVEPYVIVSFNAAGTYHLWPGIVAKQ